MTVYSPKDTFNEQHPAAQRFWRVLTLFNQTQRSMYLKYVWGRERLSNDIGDAHKLTFKPGNSHIPAQHTCFNELDIGEYESDEDLRKKLLYGIYECTVIGEEDTAYNLDADFGVD